MCPHFKSQGIRLEMSLKLTKVQLIKTATCDRQFCHRTRPAFDGFKSVCIFKAPHLGRICSAGLISFPLNKVKRSPGRVGVPQTRQKTSKGRRELLKQTIQFEVEEKLEDCPPLLLLNPQTQRSDPSVFFTESLGGINACNDSNTDLPQIWSTFIINTVFHVHLTRCYLLGFRSCGIRSSLPSEHYSPCRSASIHKQNQKLFPDYSTTGSSSTQQAGQTPSENTNSVILYLSYLEKCLCGLVKNSSRLL